MVKLSVIFYENKTMNNCGNCVYWVDILTKENLKACEQASGIVHKCVNSKFEELINKYGFNYAYPMVWVKEDDDRSELLTDKNFVCPYYRKREELSKFD